MSIQPEYMALIDEALDRMAHETAMRVSHVLYGPQDVAFRIIEVDGMVQLVPVRDEDLYLREPSA